MQAPAQNSLECQSTSIATALGQRLARKRGGEHQIILPPSAGTMVSLASFYLRHDLDFNTDLAGHCASDKEQALAETGTGC